MTNPHRWCKYSVVIETLKTVKKAMSFECQEGNSIVGKKRNSWKGKDQRRLCNKSGGDVIYKQKRNFRSPPQARFSRKVGRFGLASRAVAKGIFWETEKGFGKQESIVMNMPAGVDGHTKKDLFGWGRTSFQRSFSNFNLTTCVTRHSWSHYLNPEYPSACGLPGKL